jgi:hypothetical protein
MDGMMVFVRARLKDEMMELGLVIHLGLNLVNWMEQKRVIGKELMKER